MPPQVAPAAAAALSDDCIQAYGISGRRDAAAATAAAASFGVFGGVRRHPAAPRARPGFAPATMAAAGSGRGSTGAEAGRVSGDEAALPSAPTVASAVAPVRSTPRVGAPSDDPTEPSEQSDLAVSRRDAVSERGFGEFEGRTRDEARAAFGEVVVDGYLNACDKHEVSSDPIPYSSQHIQFPIQLFNSKQFDHSSNLSARLGRREPRRDATREGTPAALDLAPPGGVEFARLAVLSPAPAPCKIAGVAAAQLTSR